MDTTPISTTCISTVYTVQDNDLNGYHVLHGGRLLTLADEVGFLAAHRFCNFDCMTVAVHRARFHYPCKCGETLQIKAQVALTGNSSMWVPIEFINTERVCIMDAVFVYVAVDSQRQPLHIGQIIAKTSHEKALQQRMQELKTNIR